MTEDFEMEGTSELSHTNKLFGETGACWKCSDKVIANEAV